MGRTPRADVCEITTRHGFNKLQKTPEMRVVMWEAGSNVEERRFQRRVK